MGRRARNKQAPPAPLEIQRSTKPTSKRKADALEDSTPLVKKVKKVRQVEIKSKQKIAGKPLPKARKQETINGKGQAKNVSDDDDDWEDMSDEVEDLQALTRHVIPHSRTLIC